MNTLNVIKTTKEEVEKKWAIPLPYAFRNPLYVRCNAKGQINWDKTSVYTQNEIDKLENVKIIN